MRLLSRAALPDRVALDRGCGNGPAVMFMAIGIFQCDACLEASGPTAIVSIGAARFVMG
ncbi:MAG: hypothetical protein JWO59_2850 [Chloroflexi bacterium]|nr:hypothetical protein [Chloroflexota bacterium]